MFWLQSQDTIVTQPLIRAQRRPWVTRLLLQVRYPEVWVVVVTRAPYEPVLA
jgi:hypothetical protein